MIGISPVSLSGSLTTTPSHEVESSVSEFSPVELKESEYAIQRMRRGIGNFINHFNTSNTQYFSLSRLTHIFLRKPLPVSRHNNTSLFHSILLLTYQLFTRFPTSPTQTVLSSCFLNQSCTDEQLRLDSLFPCPPFPPPSRHNGPPERRSHLKQRKKPY